MLTNSLMKREEMMAVIPEKSSCLALEGQSPCTHRKIPSKRQWKVVYEPPVTAVNEQSWSGSVLCPVKSWVIPVWECLPVLWPWSSPWDCGAIPGRFLQCRAPGTRWAGHTLLLVLREESAPAASSLFHTFLFSLDEPVNSAQEESSCSKLRFHYIYFSVKEKCMDWHFSCHLKMILQGFLFQSRSLQFSLLCWSFCPGFSFGLITGHKDLMASMVSSSFHCP